MFQRLITVINAFKKAGQEILLRKKGFVPLEEVFKTVRTQPMCLLEFVGDIPRRDLYISGKLAFREFFDQETGNPTVIQFTASNGDEYNEICCGDKNFFVSFPKTALSPRKVYVGVDPSKKSCLSAKSGKNTECLKIFQQELSAFKNLLKGEKMVVAFPSEEELPNQPLLSSSWVKVTLISAHN